MHIFNYIGTQVQSGPKFETNGINAGTGGHKGKGAYKGRAHKGPREPTWEEAIRAHDEPTRAQPTWAQGGPPKA